MLSKLYSTHIVDIIIMLLFTYLYVNVFLSFLFTELIIIKMSMKYLTFTLVVLAALSVYNTMADDVCEYGDKSFDAGDSFPSSDGCNTCTCQENGLVACSVKSCDDEK
ncbi:hypothetical protein ACF0H5_020839 [Mactra antiquata]